MAEKLKIISLGGLNEIGKNLTVYEYGGDMILVDVGMGFPDDDMYGIDVVIPDFTYLIKNRERIRGIFLTHGHEDHIGSIPYLLRDVNAPIYATRMTAGLVELKLENAQLNHTYHTSFTVDEVRDLAESQGMVRSDEAERFTAFVIVPDRPREKTAWENFLWRLSWLFSRSEDYDLAQWNTEPVAP